MIKYDNNFIYIYSEKHKNILSKKLNGHWNARSRAFLFPLSPVVLEEIEKHTPEFQKIDAFQRMKQEITEKRDNMRMHKNRPPKPHQQLRPYQQQDIQYLQHLQNAAILNEPRTGKTPTLIELIKLKRLKKNLIVCPASLQINWLNEIKKWHPEATAEIFNKKTVFDKTYTIISKDTLKKTSVMHYFDSLTVDEAHYLRNRDTAQTKAVRSVKALHRYALTGTPTVKHTSDIFGILNFLYPERYSSYWAFINRYFDAISTNFGMQIGNLKPYREAELKDIIDQISTQRLRKDVMQWLPEKEYITHHVALTPKQQKAYQQMAEDFFTEHEGKEIDAQNILVQLTRLRQITADPALLDFQGIPSAKTEAILDIIDSDTYGKPLVIMSQYTSYLKLLEPQIKKLGKRTAAINGQMITSQKQQAAEAFQNGSVDVLLCNIHSAGTGFTLDKGEVVIFLDKAWNPSDNQQAEDRITPTQQDRNHSHTIVSLVCQNTIDERIEAILQNKQSLTDIINKCKSVDGLRFLF